MQIVIDIDENLYTRLFDNGKNNVMDMRRACVAIRKGILLPKDDLITKEQAIQLVEFYQINPQHFSFVNLIDDIHDETPVIGEERKVYEC